MIDSLQPWVVPVITTIFFSVLALVVHCGVRGEPNTAVKAVLSPAI